MNTDRMMARLKTSLDAGQAELMRSRGIHTCGQWSGFCHGIEEAMRIIREEQSVAAAIRCLDTGHRDASDRA